jgi:hypothetical protein
MVESKREDIPQMPMMYGTEDTPEAEAQEDLKSHPIRTRAF